MTIDPQMGRRERKKLERRQEILACAQDLFERVGFDGASVEAIAEAADVSLRTFYNFFPTKLDVLVAVSVLSIQEQMAKAAAELADPPPSPADGLFKQVEAHFRIYDQMDRDLLVRGTLHGLAQGPQNAGGADYAEYDAFSLEGVRRLVELYVRRGALRTDTDIDELAGLIFAAGNGEFIVWVVDRDASVDDVLRRMRQHIELAIAGSESLTTVSKGAAIAEVGGRATSTGRKERSK